MVGQMSIEKGVNWLTLAILLSGLVACVAIIAKAII